MIQKLRDMILTGNFSQDSDWQMATCGRENITANKYCALGIHW
jgi:hypothetical protein